MEKYDTNIAVGLKAKDMWFQHKDKKIEVYNIIIKVFSKK